MQREGEHFESCKRKMTYLQGLQLNSCQKQWRLESNGITYSILSQNQELKEKNLSAWNPISSKPIFQK